MTSGWSLSSWKELFVLGLRYSNEHTGFFFGTLPELNQLQTQRVLDSQSFQEFCWAVQIYNYSREFGYPQDAERFAETLPPPERQSPRQSSQLGQRFEDLERTVSASSAESHYEKPKFNVDFSGSLQSKYVLSGATEFDCFVVTLWRCSVAPPEVVRAQGLLPEQAALWLLTGGFRTRTEAWKQIPPAWLEDVSYERWSSTEFFFRGKTATTEVRFGAPETMKFQLTVLFAGTGAGKDGEARQGEDGQGKQASDDTPTRPTNALGDEPQEVTGAWHAKAPPVSFRTVLNYHRWQSQVFVDTSFESSANSAPTSTGFGFVENVTVLPPPSGFAAQWRFLRETSAGYMDLLWLFLQFPAYQYLLVMPMRRPPVAGALYTELLYGARVSFGQVQSLSRAQVLIASTVLLYGREFPVGVQVMVENDAVQGETDACFGAVINASRNVDFEALLDVTDIANTRGLAVLHMPNILDAEAFAVASLGSPQYAQLLVSQPVLRHQWLVAWLVPLGVLLFLLLLVALLLGFLLSRRSG